jgi:hypothetical protein
MRFMTKLEEFIKRNRRVNKSLYLDTAIEGVDYVICPVTNARMRLIKSTYITKILGMTVEDYLTKYPNLQRVCSARIESVKAALRSIDPETGLTKHQLSCVKSKQSSSRIGNDGLTRYQRSARRTRETHLKTIDELGRNGYQLQAHKRKTTILENGLTVEQNAHIKQKLKCIQTEKRVNKGASKISKVRLGPILEFISRHQIKRYFDMNEFGLRDRDAGKFYFFDLVLPTFGVAVEYNSNAFHADPRLDDTKWEQWKPAKGVGAAGDRLAYDYNKARALYKRWGYITFFVWENTYEQDVQDILCLLETMNTKY